MRIMARGTLKAFWEKHADAEGPLTHWYNMVSKEVWSTPNDIKASFRSADFVGNKVVFNIGGNNYRLIVVVNYHRGGWVFVKFVGTHAEYDKITVKNL